MHPPVEQRLDEAVGWHRQGQLARAERAYRDLLLDEPRQPDALHLLGVILAQTGHAAEGVTRIRESLSICPGQPRVHANLANALVALGNHDDALAEYDRTLLSLPDYAPALNGRGNALMNLGRCEEAVMSYRAALRHAPSLIEAHTNQGLALLQLRRPSEALDSFDRALALAPGHVSACVGKGTVNLALGDLGSARAAFERVLAAESRHAAALTGRGYILLEQGQPSEAIAAFDAALDVERDRPATLFLRGRALMLLGRAEEAAAAFRRTVEIDPGHEYAAGARLWADLHVCTWSGHGALLQHIAAAVTAGKPAAPPFVFLSVSDSPQEQLNCARLFAERHRPDVRPLWLGERYQHDRIRIAYISQDFRTHPTAFLLMGLWERHDRLRFETFAMSLSPREDSAVGRRVDEAFEHFIDAGTLTDGEIARRIRDLEIDIVLDLMGYTGSGGFRSILMRRPAPIWVNYLGYPGTLGTGDADYLIADDFLIPPAHREFFTEQIVYLPGTYQPNDRHPALAERQPTRAEAGLPDEGFVFCSFNNNYKFSPLVFDVWCRLLQNVPGSVLWLIPSTTHSIPALRLAAVERGIEPDRLIFAPHVSNPEHLARIGLADLCLDTMPVNGATTTSDALRAGVPVVTCAGLSFVARMAGSLLTGLGMPEFITATIEEYEAFALRLAVDTGLLQDLRKKLATCKTQGALFDTDRSCRSLEVALSTMWQRYQRGEPPRGFSVPAEDPRFPRTS